LIIELDKALEFLKTKLKDGDYLLGHDVDVDGLTSAVLLANWRSPNEFLPLYDFGDVNENPDILLDMTPNNKSYRGVVIDHHPLSFKQVKEDNFRYNLIYKSVPTIRIVWDLLHEEIPKDKWWYVLAGCAGEGQPEQTPLEVWEYIFKNHPELLQNVSYVSCDTYGKPRVWNDLPTYLSLSSGLNALSRLGQATESIRILLESKSPIDIISNPILKAAKNDITKIIKNTLSRNDTYSIDLGWIVILVYSPEGNPETDFIPKIEPTIAYKFHQEVGQRTSLIINAKTGKMSGRGACIEFASYKLKESGIEVGGHKGYMGGDLRGHKPEEVIEILKRVR
jgi:hypothetical protein